jgi:DHA1 family tetracycline resistance protein-like MFS transporter
MGLIGAAFGLGFILGPAVGGYFSRFGYSVPAYIAAAICFTNLCIAYFRLPESLSLERRGSTVVRRQFSPGEFGRVLLQPTLGLLICITFLATFAFSNLEATFALFTERRFAFTSTEVGYLFAYIGLLVALMQGGMIGWLARVFGERQLVRMGTLMMVAGLGFIPFAAHVWSLAIVLAILAFGLGMNTPSLSSLITQYGDPGHQGGIMGVSQSFSSLARILGPLWGGFSFDRYGISSPFISGGVVMVVAFVLSLVYLRKETVTDVVEDPASSSGV